LVAVLAEEQRRPLEAARRCRPAGFLRAHRAPDRLRFLIVTGIPAGDRAESGAITLRPATDADYDFMRRLYHSTREEEMQHFPFDDAQKSAFLDQQFAAQFEHYRIHYPTVERNIIENDGKPIGRLWIDEWRDQIRLVDIALMPEWRGSGVGSMLLHDVLRRGEKAGKPVTIH